jgi:hypothetical protein
MLDLSATSPQTVLSNALHDISAADSGGTGDHLSVTVDTIAPDAPHGLALDSSTDSGTVGDHLTNFTQLKITGTAEAGSTVQLFEGMASRGTATADGSGKWSITTPTLAEGDHTLTAVASDLAGNPSVASDPLAVSIDTTAPAIPVISSVVNDTGASNTDLITKDNTPVISGTAEASSTIVLKLGSTPIQTTTADSGGHWSFDLSAGPALADGTYTVTATDAASNESAPSTEQVLIDTSAPDAPQGLTLDTSTDSGTPGDHLTNFTQLKIDGTAEVGSTVDVFEGATSLGTATADGTGHWTVTTSPLSESDHTLSATATDVAGNVSVASDPLTVTIDTTAPAAPVISSVVNDTGALNTDLITKDNTPIISGTAEANSTIRLKLAGTAIQTTTADGGGHWSFDFSAGPAITDGAYTATATDAAGNESVASTQQVVIDTVITIPQGLNLDASTDSGTAGDNLTNFTQPKINGTAEAGSTVQLFDGITPVGSSTVNTNGAWSITASTLSERSHSLTAVATDLAGNVSAASTPLTFTIDSTAPVVTLTSPTNGSSTNDNTPTFSGIAGINAGDSTTITVKIYSGSTPMGTPVQTLTATASSALWSVTATTLADGTYTAQAQQADSAGNTGLSAARTFMVDATAPAAPQGLTLSPATDSGALGDNVTNITQLTITGTAEAGSTVKLFDGGTQLGSATAAGGGAWTITTSTLSQGVHMLTAKATDSAGSTGNASAALIVTIDSTPPAAPSTPALTPASDTGISHTDNITTLATPTFTGTAEPGSTVRLLEGSVLLGTGTATSTGIWTITSLPLVNGGHTLTASAIDAAGNASISSAARVVTIDTTGRMANPLHDATSLVKITQTNPRRIRHPLVNGNPPSANGPFFRRTLTVKNASDSSLDGALFLVLNGLPAGINVLESSGRTLAHAPRRSQFVILNASSLAPGQSVSVVLTFANPLLRPISYTPRLFAGVGTL